MGSNDAPMDPVALELLWIDRKLKRYLIAGLGMFLWAVFIGEGVADGKYHSTYPFFILSGSAVVLALAGLILKRRRKGFLLATFAVHLILWAPCIYPMTEWPGGDDGPGMAWFWFLGGACLTAVGLTARNLLVFHKQRGFVLQGKQLPR